MDLERFFRLPIFSQDSSMALGSVLELFDSAMQRDSVEIRFDRDVPFFANVRCAIRAELIMHLVQNATPMGQATHQLFSDLCCLDEDEADMSYTVFMHKEFDRLQQESLRTKTNKQFLHRLQDKAFKHVPLSVQRGIEERIKRMSLFTPSDVLAFFVSARCPPCCTAIRAERIKHLVQNAPPLGQATLQWVSEFEGRSYVSYTVFKTLHRAACQAGCDAQLLKVFKGKEWGLVNVFLWRHYLAEPACRQLQRLRDSGLLGLLGAALRSTLEHEHNVSRCYDKPDAVMQTFLGDCKRELMKYAEANCRYALFLATSFRQRTLLGPAELIAAFAVGEQVELAWVERRAVNAVRMILMGPNRDGECDQSYQNLGRLP